MSDGDTNLTSRPWYSHPFIWGWMLSLVFVVLLLALGLKEHCYQGFLPSEHCENNFQRFWKASPNEIGDSLAGLAAGLAFLWLVITAFLQRQELEDTRKEFKKMATAQDKQARLVERQISLLYNERELRDSGAAKDQLDEILRSIARAMNQEARVGSLRNDCSDRQERICIFKRRDDSLLDDYLYENSRMAHYFMAQLNHGNLKDSVPFDGPSDFHSKILDNLWHVGQISQRLGPDQKERVKNLGLGILEDELRTLFQSQYFLRADP